MSNVIRKLTSRKLWLAIAGVTTGIAMILGVNGSDITSVAGAVTALASVITYIITEGKIDAESVKTAVKNTQSAVETIEGVDDDG